MQLDWKVIILMVLLISFGAKVGVAQQVVIKIEEGNVIFNFVEPEKPLFYEVSHQFDYELAKKIFDAVLYEYCVSQNYFNELKRYENSRMIQYKNELIDLIYWKDYHKVVFIDRTTVRTKFDKSRILAQGQNFLQSIGIDLAELSLKVSFENGKLKYSQSIEQINVGGLAQGIILDSSTNQIRSLEASLYKFEKIRQIPVTKILNPSEAIQISKNELIRILKNKYNYTMEYINVRPIYICDTNQVTPAWEFVLKENSKFKKTIYLNAQTGEIVRLEGQR